MASMFIQRIKQKRMKGLAKDLAPAGLILFAGGFMLFFFEPLLMYTTNIKDFWFDLKIIIIPVLEMFGVSLLMGLLMLLMVYFGNLFFSENLLVYRGTVLIGFICFILLYLQGNWMSGNLPILTGEKIIWENYGKTENIVLMCVLFLLCVVLAVGIHKIKFDRVIQYAAMSSSVIIVMLIVSLIPTMITNNAFRSKELSFSPSTENFNTISTNKNFLIFQVDTVDSRVFYDVMNSDDDFCQLFEDFTYYPDTLSLYPWTLEAVPAILTGVLYRNGTDYLDYCAKAYSESPFFHKLDEKGYDINLYSWDIRWNGERNYFISNSSLLFDKIRIRPFVIREFKYIAFKYLPYPLKKYSQIEEFEMDYHSLTGQRRYGSGTWQNRSIYNMIQSKEDLDTQNANYFQLIHCQGAHLPLDTDKYLNTVEDGTYEGKVAASLTVIKAYLQRLKDNNAYDNSVIVIMADHGYDTGQNDEEVYAILGRCNPILFIKGINEKHNMRKSDKMISHLDLQDAFCALIDGRQSDELFGDIGTDRTRLLMWESSSGADIVEYETTGKAYEVENFYPTGNVYKSQ